MAVRTRAQRITDWWRALLRWERRRAEGSRGRVYEKRQLLFERPSRPTAMSHPIPALHVTVEKANGDRIHLAGRGPGR